MLCWTEATLAGLEAATSLALHQQHLSGSQVVCQGCGGTPGWSQSRGKQHKRQLSIQVRAGASASADISVGQGNGSGSGPNSGGGGGGWGGSSSQHAGGLPLRSQLHGNAAQTEEVILMDISGNTLCLNLSLSALRVKLCRNLAWQSESREVFDCRHAVWRVRPQRHAFAGAAAPCQAGMDMRLLSSMKLPVERRLHVRRAVCPQVMFALQAVVNLPTETALVYVVIPAEQQQSRDHDAFLEEIGQRLVKVDSCSKGNYVLSKSVSALPIPKHGWLTRPVNLQDRAL